MKTNHGAPIPLGGSPAGARGEGTTPLAQALDRVLKTCDVLVMDEQGHDWPTLRDAVAVVRAALPAPTTDATALRAAAEIGGAMFKAELESNGMYQRDGWIFTYTDAGDLGVWAARSFNEEADAAAMFYGDDPEDDAFLWLANTRAALTSTPGAPTP